MVPPPTLNVLIVEDVPAHARLVEEALKNVRSHVKVTVSTSAEEALNHLMCQEAPETDLIVLDLRLPDGNGLEVLAAVRRHRLLQSVPVLVLSCSDERSDLARAYALHANCFIPKPDTYSELQQTVASAARFWLGTAFHPDPRQPSPRWGTD